MNTTSRFKFPRENIDILPLLYYLEEEEDEGIDDDDADEEDEAVIEEANDSRQGRQFKALEDQTKPSRPKQRKKAAGT